MPVRDSYPAFGSVTLFKMTFDVGHVDTKLDEGSRY